MSYVRKRLSLERLAGESDHEISNTRRRVYWQVSHSSTLRRASVVQAFVFFGGEFLLGRGAGAGEAADFLFHSNGGALDVRGACAAQLGGL